MMAFAYDATLFLYNITLIPMTFFSVLFILIVLVNLFIKKPRTRYRNPVEWPLVSVQIPTFNDPIAARCLERCLEFDYPKERYEILIVDDSTNVQTQALLSGMAEEHENVKYIHRTNREGYKPGALKNAMKYTKGEILVVFDADWIPKKNFLKKVVRPFQDEDIAIVQTMQGFYNHKQNMITRFAAYTLMIYHAIVMPINNQANCVFFCGTAGAIRRSAFDEVGGWSTESLTEDSELSLRLLLKGYKTVYLPDSTPSEVPDTFEGFLKQQMRWCYGNARVFIDNWHEILIGRKLTFGQKAMVTYFTIGNVIAPIVVLMTIFGFLGWFLGDPALMGIDDVFILLIRFGITIGFLVLGFVALHKLKILKEARYLILSALTVGLVLCVANTLALTKAVFNKPLSWYCTPKSDNTKLVK